MKARYPLSTLLLVLLASPHCAIAQTGPQVGSETSRTPALAPTQWKLAAFPSRNATPLRYRELSISRLLDVQRYNTVQRIKATQIGVGRGLADEGVDRTTPVLRWIPLKTGGAVARLQVTSPDALGLRVGLQLQGLHPHVELRFGGSDAPSQAVATVNASEAQRLVDAQGIYWTPGTDGATQIIEIYRPAHVKALQARLQAPKLSHLLTNSRNDFKLLKSLGDAGSCNIDVVCKVAEYGPAFVQAKNAVAHMTFVESDGKGYVCTGTLLNDTVPSTQVPYFYTAAHCISSQSVANTLNTYWAYENSTCGGADGARRNPVVGGADLLYADEDLDALLLRLKNPAPANATFAGWDASTLANSADVIAIHHPQGDAKKVSRGQHVTDAYAELYTVAWLEGTTEGGSSGSGLFTRYRDNSLRLRGGLLGGDALCSNTGSTGNALNRDHYSRLDLVFPHIKQWIASEPVRENSSQPLVRSAGAVAQGQGSRTITPTQTMTRPTARPAIERPRTMTPTRHSLRER